MPSATAPATITAGMRNTASATTSAARPGNKRACRPVRRRPAWRGVYSPTDRNFAARAGSLDLDENHVDRSRNLLDATGRTQFIRFRGAAEGHPANWLTGETLSHAGAVDWRAARGAAPRNRISPA